MQHAACFGIAGIVQQRDDQVRRPGERGGHREYAGEELGIFRVEPRGGGVRMFTKIMRTPGVEHRLTDLADQRFDRTGNVPRKAIDAEQSQIEESQKHHFVELIQSQRQQTGWNREFGIDENFARSRRIDEKSRLEVPIELKAQHGHDQPVEQHAECHSPERTVVVAIDDGESRAHDRRKQFRVHLQTGLLSADRQGESHRFEAINEEPEGKHPKRQGQRRQVVGLCRDEGRGHEQDCAAQHGTDQTHRPCGVEVARLLRVLVSHDEKRDVGIEDIADHVQNGNHDGDGAVSFRQQNSCENETAEQPQSRLHAEGESRGKQIPAEIDDLWQRHAGSVLERGECAGGGRVARPTCIGRRETCQHVEHLLSP